MKKALALILAAMLALSCASCGGTASSSSPDGGAPADSSGAPAAQEKVKFSATFIKNDWHGDPHNMETLTKIAERANVEVDWQIYQSATWPDKKNLLISSGDMPDVMYMNSALKSNEVAKYAKDGMLLDLTGLIPEYAPRLAKVFEEMPIYKVICTNADDGRIYSLGRAAERPSGWGAKLFINKTWLNKLGLEMPTTVDEYYAALQAFKTQDPNGNNTADEIPFSFYGNLEKPNASYSFSDLFGPFGYPDIVTNSIAHFIKDENGEIIYTAMTEGYRDAIAFWHKAVAEGLWDKEGFTTTDLSVLSAKGNNDPQILGSFSAWSANMILPAAYLESGDYALLPPLKGPDGKQTWLRFGSDNNNVNPAFLEVTVKAKGKEEGIMRWIDEHFDPEISKELFLGPIGTCLQKDDKGYITYADTPEGMSYSDFRYGNSPVHVPCAIKLDEWDNTIEMMEEDKRLDEYEAVYGNFRKMTTFYTSPTSDQSDYLATKGKDIDQYVNKMQMKWLVEGGIEKEWDTYLKELEKLGIQEYIQMEKDMDAKVQEMMAG